MTWAGVPWGLQPQLGLASRITCRRRLVALNGALTSLGELGVAKFLAPRLGCLQSIPRPLSDHFSLMLSHRGKDMNGELVGVRVIDRDELDTGVHQRCDEREIARQSIELGDDELGFVLLAGR